MIYFCLRNVPVPVSVDFRPVSQVHILQISKMALVKQTERERRLCAINGRAAAARKNLHTSLIAGSRPSFPPGPGPAGRQVIIPGVIDDIPLLKVQHLRTAGEYLLRSADSRQKCLHKMLFRLRVIVQQNKIRRPGMPDPYIYRPAEPCISFEGNYLKIRQRR